MSRYNIDAMDVAGTSKFIRIVAKRAGLRAVFHPLGEITTPYTNPLTKEIHVDTPHWSFTPVEHMLWLGKVLHELGHWRDGNQEIMEYCLAKKIDMRSLLGTVMNILSDWINDQQWQGELDGAHRAVVMIQIECARRGLDHLQPAPMPEDEKTLLMIRIFAWIYARRAATFQPQLLPAAQAWGEVINFDSLLEFNSELNAIHDGQSCYDLAVKIIKSDGQSCGEGEGGEEGEDGEGDDGGEGEDDSDGDGDSKDKKKGKSKERKESFVSYREILLADDHGKTVGEKGAPVTIEYDHDWQDNYSPHSDYDEVDLSREVP